MVATCVWNEVELLRQYKENIKNSFKLCSCVAPVCVNFYILVNRPVKTGYLHVSIVFTS